MAKKREKTIDELEAPVVNLDPDLQMTEKLSGGVVTIGSGTMYGATGNMMKKGWIREIMSNEAGLERRRLYQLTDQGREALKAEIERLKRMLENAEEV